MSVWIDYFVFLFYFYDSTSRNKCIWMGFFILLFFLLIFWRQIWRKIKNVFLSFLFSVWFWYFNKRHYLHFFWISLFSCFGIISIFLLCVWLSFISHCISQKQNDATYPYKHQLRKKEKLVRFISISRYFHFHSHSKTTNIDFTAEIY